MIELCVYFTAKDGSTCKITGDQKAIVVIERIFEAHGVHYNEQVETWDEGYYQERWCHRTAQGEAP